MGEDTEFQDDPTDRVELVSDGENLLIVGKDRRSVESFLHEKGLAEKARELGQRQFSSTLRTSAQYLERISSTVAESSLWLKMTPESAKTIKKFGLTDSGVPGVSYAMAGSRGNIREWIKVDTTNRAQLANPAILSGTAAMLSQAARQHEAAELRDLLASLDHKLDKVIQGQKDELVGDLIGIERQVRTVKNRVEAEGKLDSLTWSSLAGTSVGLRQVQAKALLKLQAIAGDLESNMRFGDLHQMLIESKVEVNEWLSVLARCTAALDDLAVLELDYLAVLEPQRLDARRATLDSERHDDRIELENGIRILLQRLDDAAQTANENKLFHRRGVPKALASIKTARGLVERVYDVLGFDVHGDSVDPTTWREALLQAKQWKNGLHEGGTLAWEKGKPVAGGLALAAASVAVGVVKDKFESSKDPMNREDRKG
ncbi:MULTISPECIES: hypothetical protein [unclassified Glutamicibacter]|uniref:hypothetical protein n=1 Tax=unclassified Glutamicibacter TaxID=2627139 RepID=UPI0037F9E186